MITGGLGAIGSFVTRLMAENGESIVVFDIRRDESLLGQIQGDIRLITGDLLDVPGLVRTLQDNSVDCVIHLAALMPPECEADPHRAVRINIQGTLHLLEAARTLGVRRFVYACSKSVYGAITGAQRGPQFAPLTEDYRVKPGNVYAVTKYAGEQLGLRYWHNWGLDFISLRFGLTFGPGKLTHHGNLGLPSRMIENAVAGIPLHLPSGGDQLNDLVYNRDCAAAVVGASAVGSVRRRVFNVSSGRLSSLSELAAAIKSVIPESRVDVGPGMDYLGAQTYCLMDISAARQDLRYEPQFADLRLAVGDYADTMRKLGLATSA